MNKHDVSRHEFYRPRKFEIISAHCFTLCHLIGTYSPLPGDQVLVSNRMQWDIKEFVNRTSGTKMSSHQADKQAETEMLKR